MPTFTDNINSQYRAELVVTQGTQDVANNRTSVSWVLRVRKLSGSGYWTAGSPSWSVNINGSTASGGWSYDFNDYTLRTIDSGSLWVNHDADGGKTFSASASVSMSNPPGGTGTPSGNTTLTTIPRASVPTFSPTSIDAGSTVTISTNRASSSFTHTISYSFGSSSGTIDTGVTTSTTWTPPLSLLSQIPNATSGACTITVKTYNGSTLIGTKTATLTIKAPSSVVPSFSTVTHEEATAGVEANIGAYVKSISKLTLNLTGATGIYGSSINSRKLEVLSGSTILHTINSGSGTTPVISASGTLTLRGTITDSRGRSATKTVNITVLNWAPPVLTSVSAQRANSGGTVDPNGTYIRVNLNISASSLIVSSVQKNAINYRIKTRTKGDTTWVTKGSWTPGGIAFNSNRVVGTYAITSAHEVLVEVYDDFATSAQQLIIATSSIFMHWGNANDGEGVGVGKYWEQGALDVAGDIYQNNALVIAQYGNLGTANLDNITTPGYYIQTANAEATSARNYPPPGRAGSLDVSTFGDLTRQTYTDYQNVTKWERTKYGSSWYPWKCIHPAGLVWPTVASNATTASDGRSSFNNVAAIRLEGIFDNTFPQYRNHRLLIDVNTMSEAATLFMRFTTGTSADATTNYDYTRHYGYETGTYGISSINQNRIELVGGSGTRHSVDMTVYEPSAGGWTDFQGISGTRNANQFWITSNISGVYDVSKVFDGIYLYPGSGTFSGHIQVFGIA